MAMATSMMLVRRLANELLPSEARDLLSSGIASLRSRMTWRRTGTIVIEHYDGWHTNNEFYAVMTYLDSRMEAVGTPNALKHPPLSSGGMDDEDPDKGAGEEMVDVYEGAEFRWCLYTHPDLYYASSSGSRIHGRGSGKLYFQLTFHKKHKKKALGEYIPFVVATAKAIRNKEWPLTIYMNGGVGPLTLYMNDGSKWTSTDIYRPSTFAALAMDHALKQSVIDDLNKFIKRKAYCKRTGKAWKRGYLLYGPPGTGKSGLIVAMANHLRFDIYDLELTGVESNSQLRKLLLGMTNQSILVIHDMDDKKNKLCNSQSGKDDKVTLSGLLNIIGALWSTAGEERIVVLTTNHKEGLDPAFLRPGMMDMHVHMGYCTSETFRIFVNNCRSNYNPDSTNLEIEELVTEIEELMAKVAVTPPEVAEILVRRETIHVALLDIIELLKSKKERANKEEEDGDDDGDHDDDKVEDDYDAKKEEDDDDSGDNDDDDDNEN